MESRLFRQKSVDRINSPEQLQDYMKVTSPSVWMVLVAVIVLLVGLLVSSALATLESSVPVEAQVADGAVAVDLPLAQSDNVAPGMELRVGGKTATIDFVFRDQSDIVTAMGEVEGLPDGTYEAEIVTEKISPIKLLFN